MSPKENLRVTKEEVSQVMDENIGGRTKTNQTTINRKEKRNRSGNTQDWK